MATRKPNFAESLSHDFVDHLIDLLRVAETDNVQVRKLLRQLERDLAGKLSSSGLSAAQQDRLFQVLNESRAYFDAAFNRLTDLNKAQILDLIPLEVEVAAGIVNRAVGVDVFSAALSPSALANLASSMLIQGAPSEDWWAKQKLHTTFRFEQEMRMGLAANETNGQLVQRVRGAGGIPGLLSNTRLQAEMLVRTSVQTASMTARNALFAKNKDVMNGIQQISTLDTRTSLICIAYDHATWTLAGKPIKPTTLPYKNGTPRHWGCRSTIVPLLKTAEELGLDLKLPPRMRESMDGAVAADTTFGDWLASRSVVQQNKLLGVGKADLWRKGEITLNDLLDQRGNSLTLGQLRRKHGL